MQRSDLFFDRITFTPRLEEEESKGMQYTCWKERGRERRTYKKKGVKREGMLSQTGKRRKQRDAWCQSESVRFFLSFS